MKLTTALITAYATSGVEVGQRNGLEKFDDSSKNEGGFLENLTPEEKLAIREDNLNRTPIVRAVLAKVRQIFSKFFGNFFIFF